MHTPNRPDIAPSPPTILQAGLTLPSLTGEAQLAKPGSMLGRYQVESALGQGGMGAVFKAKDTLLGRSVAIKTVLVPQDSTDMNIGLRFLREAEVLASMDHPHIVRIFDAGTHDNHPYLVLEHLAGELLADRLRRKRRFRLSEALTLLLPVCNAIEHAHSRGVLHLDLKPTNIFVTKDADGEAACKVLDFGVCMLSEVDAELDPTRHDQAGTPAYMSPEMLSGREPTRATDLFSLAVILYECISGVNPFATSRSLVEVKRVICEKRYPKLQTLCPQYSEQVSAVVEKGMSPEPEARYSSARELTLALEALMGQAQDEVSPPIQEAPPTCEESGVTHANHGVTLAANAKSA